MIKRIICKLFGHSLKKFNKADYLNFKFVVEILRAIEKDFNEKEYWESVFKNLTCQRYGR